MYFLPTKALYNINRIINKNSTTNIEIIMVGFSALSQEEVKSAKHLFKGKAEVKIFGYLDRAGNNSFYNILPSHQTFGRIIGCELNRLFERLAIYG
jgi:hypothetical protein